MALTRKRGPAQSTTLIGTIPPLPKLPAKFVDRFDELTAYQAELDRWWSRFGDMLQRDRDSISARFTVDEEQDSTETALLNATIAALQAQVTALAAQVAALSPGGDAADIAAVSAALAAHIASTTTHGTISRIVGQSDAQPLDNKTIGQTGPNYGRFAPPVGLSSILPTQVITVGPQDFMVVAGTFSVAGTIKIEGTLIAV